MKPMFDFQLWEPSRDLCFSDPANGTQCLHWFALTFADYCMNFGNVTLFQYTKEVLDSWKMPSSNKEQKLSRCDDYQIAGVLQPDFDGVLGYVGEPLPEDFRQITQSTKELLAYRRKYDNLNDSLYVKLEEDFPDDCQNPEKETREDEIYHYEETLIHWLSHRRWWQWYLTNSLQIWFFRYGDDIQIVWDTEREYDGIPVWTAKNGTYRMKYAEFVREMEDFGDRFFTAMEEQIRKAVAMDWGDVEIDKPGLWTAQAKNRKWFAGVTDRLKNPQCDTDWDEVRAVIHKAFPGEYFE